MNPQAVKPSSQDDPDEKAGLIKEEPVALIGALLVVAEALVVGLGIGELEDGFQVGDILVFAATVLSFIAARSSAFSPATVERIRRRSRRPRPGTTIA